MAETHWQKVEELFHAALALDGKQREALLACDERAAPAMVAQVRSLLRAYEQGGAFFDALSAFWQSATSLPPPEPPLQQLAHFRILSLLGRGGMGEVYLAEDTRLKRQVAIKALLVEARRDAQARQRLLREAQVVARLDHPHICPIYEIREETDRVFIVMQYVEGETLFTRMQRQPLSVSDTLEIAIQIAGALGEAHEHGILHRDIKPQNVVINLQGQVKVLDFGLAKRLELQPSADGQAAGDSCFDSLLTEENAVLGTPLYMSPEQVRGEPLDCSSDLFSLGVLLFECLTHRQPFAGSSLAEIFANILCHTPPPASTFNRQVPRQLDALLARTLAKEVSARHRCARDLVTELRAIASLPLAAPLNPAQLPSRRWTATLGRLADAALAVAGEVLSRRAARLTAILVAALLVAFVLWLGGSQGTLMAPSPARQWYEDGVREMNWEAYHRATKLLERAIALDNRLTLAHARLAEAWLELDYPERAKDALLLALSSQRHNEPLAKPQALYLEAVNATLQRDFAGAVAIYRQLADEARGAEKPRAYLTLGRAYEKSEDYDKAMESYAQAIAHDPRYAPAFLRRGLLYGRQQDWRNALAALDEAESLYRALGNLEGVAQVLYGRGCLLNSADRLPEAEAQLTEALKIAETLESKHQQAQTLLQLSSVFYSGGKTTRARDYATQAVELARREQLENLTVSGLLELGNTDYLSGAYEHAKSYFQQAAEFAEQCKGRRNEARALLSLGSVLMQQNQTDAALPLVERAMTFYEQSGYRKEVLQALSLLGRGYGQQGDYDGALRTYERQLQLAKEVNDQPQIALAHLSVGSILGFFQERYTEALPHFDTSYQINTSLGALNYAAYCLLYRGNHLWAVGRYEEAQTALAQVYAIAHKPDSKDDYLLAWVYLFLARMEVSRDRCAVAQRRGQQSLALAATRFPDIAMQAKAVLGLATALAGVRRSSGRRLGAEAVEEAMRLKNPRYTGEALLCLAETLLVEGAAGEALEKAVAAQASFTHFGQPASEWQSVVVAARAAVGVGDKPASRRYALRALELLSVLEQRWGAENYARFLGRPDVRKRRQQLDRLLVAAQ